MLFSVETFDNCMAHCMPQEHIPRNGVSTDCADKRSIEKGGGADDDLGKCLFLLLLLLQRLLQRQGLQKKNRVSRVVIGPATQKTLFALSTRELQD